MTVAPIFSGGGMKVKIAESLMHNRAVISTTFAAIGYEDTDSDSIITADDAQSFARKIESWNPQKTNQPIQDFLAFYSLQSNLNRLCEIANKAGIEI